MNITEREVDLIEKAAKRAGMVSLLNHGAASCVYSEGCNGVTQEHLMAFAREIALYCATALYQPNLDDAQGEIRALRATEAGLRDRLAATAPLLERIAALDAKLAQRVPDGYAGSCFVSGAKEPVVSVEFDTDAHAEAFFTYLAAAPAAPEQQEPKKEISNVELDRDSNTTGNRQQRNMVRALEVGQLVAKSRKQGGGDPAAEKEFKLIVKDLAEPIAQATAENCRSVPQLTFPHIYLGLTDLILEIAQAPNAQQAELPPGWKTVVVPEDVGPEPDWEDVRYQAETATGIELPRAVFSIVIREVRRWLAAQQAEAQEPCAWRHSKTFCLYETEEEVPLADGDEWAEPLFTRPKPAQHQPLTIAEVEAILARWSYELHGDRSRFIVRETELAHGIVRAAAAMAPEEAA